MKIIVAALSGLGVMHLFMAAGLSGLIWGIVAGLIGGVASVVAFRSCQS